ncbi:MULTISPECIES: hypothetical protein [unclassified Haloparvum]|uniref:hypothetical protein n=1 Tax=Haloparvum sp. PAK95 TaxID=3418962 RepID=UPI003D2EEC0B
MSGPLGDGSALRRSIAALRQNRDQLVVDAAVLLSWIVVSAALFRWLTLPQWLHYLVLFGGVVVYSKLTSGWDQVD